MEEKEWRGEPYCLSRWWVGNLRGGKVAQWGSGKQIQLSKVSSRQWQIFEYCGRGLVVVHLSWIKGQACFAYAVTVFFLEVLCPDGSMGLGFLLPIIDGGFARLCRMTGSMSSPHCRHRQVKISISPASECTLMHDSGAIVPWHRRHGLSVVCMCCGLFIVTVVTSFIWQNSTNVKWDLD